MSDLLYGIYPISLIKFDVESEMPVRDKNGFCVPCKTGEAGNEYLNENKNEIN